MAPPLPSLISSPSSSVTVGFNSDNYFRVDRTILNGLVKERNLESLRKFCGLEGIVSALKTSKEDGIQDDDDANGIQRRREEFGPNTYPKPHSKSFLHFVGESSKDPINLLFFLFATLSLGCNIKEHGLKDGWHVGGIIFVVVFIAIAVSSISTFRQNRQLDKLSEVSNDIKIEVVRSGRRQQISTFEIVVGDAVCLKIGDKVPADGLFLEGHSLHVDESNMTGESDHAEVNSKNPFLFSGTMIVDGVAKMLVTSVGVNTRWGQMMSSISLDTKEQTPLQLRLNKLTSLILHVIFSMAFLVLVVLLIGFFTGNTTNENENKEFNGGAKLNYIVNAVMGIVAAVVTIVVVVILEELPLIVIVTLAYSMKKIMANQAMARKLSACETMGSVTTICADKTGTLTLNQMKVTKFWLGQQPMEEHAHSLLATDVLGLFREGVALNTTGSVYKTKSDYDLYEFTGSPTEKAILSWAVSDLDLKMEEVKRNCNTLHVEVFNSEKKRSGVLIRRKADNKIHVHWKGAAEMLLKMCSRYYDASGNINDLDNMKKLEFEKIIQGMAASRLRCIAFAHEEAAELKEDGLTLLGLVGIKDPCRPGVKKAVEDFQHGGINVKLITGDDVYTAKAIATECGILHLDNDTVGAVMEGQEFENYTPEQRLEKVDRIIVMARCSPFHKLLMVQCLKEKGHVVAVVGDGTDDAPALKESNIGICMGSPSTQLAKESSDFVIMDDDFDSVATLLRYGRWVRNCHFKFITVQLTVNIVAIAMNMLAAIQGGELPLTVVHLCSGNIIIYIMGTLGLVAQDTIWHTLPMQRERTKISVSDFIWSNAAKALYQIALIMVLQLGGESFFSANAKATDIFIFSAFVLYQVFSEFYPQANPIPNLQFLTRADEGGAED